jgi:acyl carrier protein
MRKEKTDVAGDDDILPALTQIARTHLEWDGILATDMPLVETLSLDSLRLLTLIVEVENRFRVTLDEEDETTIRTVGDLVDTIRRKRAAPAPHPR